MLTGSGTCLPFLFSSCTCTCSTESQITRFTATVTANTHSLSPHARFLLSWSNLAVGQGHKVGGRKKEKWTRDRLLCKLPAGVVRVSICAVLCSLYSALCTF